MQQTIPPRLLAIIGSSSIIHLYGKAGTGKSSLMQFLSGRFLMHEKDASVVWVRASQAFSERRLSSLFSVDRRKRFTDRLFLIPKDGKCRTLSQQNALLGRIADGTVMLPPSVRAIVIDDISHHLRKSSGNQGVTRHMFLKNQFFEEVLAPLILLCSRQKLTLILIHEVTQVPTEEGREEIIKPYYYTLYERIPALNIFLSETSGAYLAELGRTDEESSLRIPYHIRPSGFRFRETDYYVPSDLNRR